MKKLLGAMLILFGIFLLLGSFIRSDISGWFLPGDEQVESAALEGVDTIEISAPSANTRIIPEDRQQIKAVMHGRQVRHLDLHVQRNGNKVEVTVEEKWFDWFAFGSDVKLDVYVPKTYNQNIHIDVDSGNVEFAGPSTTPPILLRHLSLEISSGNVHLKHLQLDQLQTDGGSGNVDIDQVKAESGKLKVTSGNIGVRHYEGALDAELTSGNLKAQIDLLAGPVKINATSGDITLDLPHNADFTLEADVSSGDIQSDFPLQHAHAEENESLSGSFGSGKHSVNLETTSGTIRIR